MKKYKLEMYVGIFVFIGLVCLSYMTVKLGKMEVFSSDGYTLTANFTSITGLKTGASIEISGVQVGKVTGIKLNKGYLAEVSMQLNKGVELSDDSIASVKTSGLIGDKYVSISRGGSDVVLADGDVMVETESAVDIESLISKYVFGGVE